MAFSLAIVYFCIITTPLWSKLLLKNSTNPMNIVAFNDLFTLMLPMILLYFLSSTCIAILHRYEHFGHANIGQPIANVFMVLTIIVGYSLSNSYNTLSACTLAGATIHYLWQYYGARRISRSSMRPIPFFPDKIAEFLAGLIASLPAIMCLYFFVPFSFFTNMVTITTIIILVALFGLCVVHMRKQPRDLTLEYGGIITNGNLIWSIIYYACIALSIISKVSFLKDSFYISTLINLLVLCLTLYNLFTPKQYKERAVIHNIIAKATMIPLSFVACIMALIAVNNVYFRDCYILLTIIERFTYLYRMNVVSSSLPSKIQLINRNFLRISGNAFFGTGINQIMSFVSIAISPQLGPGAPSYMSRADKITQFPIGILGVSFGVALLPRISRLISEGKNEEAQNTYNSAIMLNLGLSLVVIIACLWIAEPIARLFFFGGKTTLRDISVICTLFKIQLLALPSSVVIKTLYPIYFATHQSALITKAAVVQCCTDVSLKIMTLYFGLGLKYMVLSWVVGSWANAAFLLLNSSKFIDPFQPFRNLFR